MSLITKRSERRRKLRFIDRLIADLERRHKKKRAKRARGRLKAQRRAIEKLTRHIRKRRKRRKRQSSLRYVRINSSDWGGSGSVLTWIEGFMQRRGLPLGSGKRTPSYNAAIGGSSTSDHLTTKTTTDARDFPTYSGADDAIALSRAMGQANWRPGSYNSFTVRVGNRNFNVQVLWAVSGHYDHVHVGVSRA